MKNLKVSWKLIVSFIIVIVLALIVGAVGIVGMAQMNAADDTLYQMNVVAIEALGEMETAFINQRVQLRNLVIYDASSDVFNNSLNSLTEQDKAFQEALKVYEPTVTEDLDKEHLATIKEQYQEFINNLPRMIELGKQNENTEAQKIMDEILSPIAAKIDVALIASVDLNSTYAKEAVDSNTSLFTRMTIIEIVVLLLAVAIAMLLAFYIAGLISKPLRDMMGYIKQAGETGNLRFRDDEWANLDRISAGKDEIAQTMKAFTEMLHKFVYYGEAVNKVADRDLSFDVETLGQNDTFGNAIKQMLDNLNHMFADIHNSTQQVASGSKQIADGAQALAQGSTEQAATVEELSASTTEIAEKTKDNADMASKAATLANQIKQDAEKSNHQMSEMMTAVSDINQASQSIGKVIKVIDDIAFQTNILALNAAVEAARAGQHGKGFAVVAEEVRNLAAKSAEAARDTGSLIANSITKSETGARIAQETANSLVGIITGINESSQIVNEIATSSIAQSDAVMQINEGIDQVAQVVQQNSATAEESAAASEELSGQSDMLEQLISQFKIKATPEYAMSSPSMQSSRSNSMDTGFSLNF